MKSILLSLLLLASTISHAQWTPITDFPDTERFSATDFTINNEVYLIGGIIEDAGSYTAFDIVWKFDATNETWNPIGMFPGGKRYAMISFVAGGQAFVGLGANENGVQNNQLWAYNPATGLWSPKAPFPGDPRSLAFAFTSNGKGYVGGGISWASGPTVQLNDLWEYDPFNDEWNQRANYPGGGRIGMTAVTINDEGYVGFGDDGAFFYDGFYRYNTSSDSWTLLSQFPGQIRSFYATTPAAGKGYLIGGEAELGGDYTHEMWSYDPANDSWNHDVDFNGPARAYANLFFLNNNFYYGLGLIGLNDDEGSSGFWKRPLNTTNISEVKATPTVEVFPNPAHDQLTIRVTHGVQIERIILRNALGAMIAETTETNLSLADLPQQIYTLEIHTTAGHINRRIVKSGY